jgi:hypothetical protein
MSRNLSGLQELGRESFYSSTWAKLNADYSRFQEQILSRRMIIFVNGQVYFRCRQRIWSEDTFADRFPKERLTDEWSIDLISYIASELPDGADIEDDPTPLPLLTNMLEYYSMREVKYPGDAIDAVSGLLRIVSTRMSSELLQGLLVVVLDYMITFLVLLPQRTHSGSKKGYSHET